MTEYQAELYETYASTILCIDSTHGINQYSGKLITLLIVDGNRIGYPVAWCITHRETKAVITAFFQAVKDRCLHVQINYLMSDDDSKEWSAALDVFGCSIT